MEKQFSFDTSAQVHLTVIMENLTMVMQQMLASMAR
jgi:hypothetical protein